MEHYKSGQYDDDLTVGIDDYDDDFDAGDVDLFDYVGDEDSPLSRLKSIILSIDWEITDDILRQFNEELHELKDIWAGEKINLIYVQALEKISRYIYKEKSSAHPNAIKLLLAFYSNLEKIVSDDSLPGEETKRILVGDIERFEKLKKQISPAAQATSTAPTAAPVPAAAEPAEPTEPVEPAEPVEDDIPEAPAVEEPKVALTSDEGDDPLLNLKAIVYGIDWEITERDLKNLSSEVKLLVETFKSSKAKQIFLQGIGSLGAYIKLKKSDANPDAFKLLHSFFVGLETVVRDNLSGQAEKDILLPQVEKFNAFKATIAETISPDVVEKAATEPQETEDEYGDSEIQPAFADVPDDVQGFKEEDEVAELDSQATAGDGEESIDEFFEDEVENKISEGDKALASEMESRLEGMFDEPSEDAARGLDADVALQGVDVESEADDESDEEPLPFEDGEIAPALAAEEPLPGEEESPAVFADKEDDIIEEPEAEAEEEIVFADDVPGVDVEHEADDDTDEPPLLAEDGEFAPAFADNEKADLPDEEVIKADDIDDKIDDFFGEPTADDIPEEAIPEEELAISDDSDEEEISAPVTTEIDDKVIDFFGDDESQPPPETDATALAGVDVETDADDDTDEEPLPEEDGEIVPALAADEAEEELVATTPDEADLTDEVGFGEIKVSEEDDESETAEVDDRFDQLFAEEQDEPEVADTQETPVLAGEDDETLEVLADDTLSEDVEISLEEDQILQGVDVESEDDDDSDEEPLPFEDGEFAPALGADTDSLAVADETVDEETETAETDESAVADRFDAVFSADDEAVDFEPEMEVTDELTESDEIAVADEFEFEAAATEEEDFEEDLELEAEFEAEALSDETSEVRTFEDAGFEEIVEEEIEEIPEEAFLASDEETSIPDEDELSPFADIDEDEEEEILALLDDEADTETLFAEEADDIAAAVNLVDEDTITDDDLEEIPVDELATVLSETEGVAAAGDIPSGYPTTDELFSEFGEVAGDDADQAITHPDDNTDYIVAVEGLDEIEENDEEVVFEPIADEAIVAEADEDDLIEPDLSFDEGTTFGTTLLTDDVDLLPKEEISEEFVADVPEELLADEISEISEEETVTAETAESAAYVAAETEVPTEDNLSDLRDCIVSLGLEIDDGIVNSLNKEIENLRHAWLDKPAEKTFIQLLSTISGHIAKFRYDADPEANKLLLSVFDKLELCSLGQSDDGQIQESILNETSKVLQWQARLIDRAPVVEGETADSGPQAPVTEEAEPEIETDVTPEITDFTAPADNDMEKKQLMENVSAIMRSEIDQLIQAFQTEIKGLKDEIRQVKDSKE